MTATGYRWPTDPARLVDEQERIGRLAPEPWTPATGAWGIAGCFLAFFAGEAGPGRAGDRAWSAAALVEAGRLVEEVVVRCEAGAPYQPGLLALREGLCLELAVAGLGRRPEVLMVDATGRDHPRRAGMAVHLGVVLGLPSVGVTHRPLLATGPHPGPERGAWSPLVLEGEEVGRWVRTRSGTRPVVAHAGWRTDAATAMTVVLHAGGTTRTPEPLRLARTAARTARAGRR